MRCRPGLTAVAVVALLAGCSAPSPSEGEITGTVTVLAAASLTDVFDELAARFESDNPGADLVLVYAGSSALAEQVLSGAPADVFAPADESLMQRIVDASLAHDPAPFASNSLQLAVPAGNPGGVASIADLARPELAVALCDPTVPCGWLAATLLERAGVVASIDTLEQDARAVVTKLSLGEVDAALVYRTDVIAAAGAVEGIEVSGAGDARNRYPIVRLAEARNPAAADAFVDLVLSPAGRAALRGAGFGAP